MDWVLSAAFLLRGLGHAIILFSRGTYVNDAPIEVRLVISNRPNIAEPVPLAKASHSPEPM